MNMITSDLLTELIKQTDSIRQIINRIKESGRISEIDKDLLLDKIRIFYDHTLQVNTAADEIKDEVSVKKSTLKTKEPVIPVKEELSQEKNTEEIISAKENLPSDSYELILNENEDTSLKPELKSTEKEVNEATLITTEEPDNVKSKSAKVEQVEIQPSLFENQNISKENQNTGMVEVEKEIIHQAFSQKETIADKYLSENKKSLNDIMAELRKEKDLATRMQYKPVKDLREAITLNDRVKYIREVFGQDKAKYDLAITKLNNCKDLDEAMEYINANISWDNEKPSFRNFLELIYRRHLPQNE